MRLHTLPLPVVMLANHRLNSRSPFGARALAQHSIEPPSALWGEPVAVAVNGVDVFGILGILFDLQAQPADQVIDAPR